MSNQSADWGVTRVDSGGLDSHSCHWQRSSCGTRPSSEWWTLTVWTGWQRFGSVSDGPTSGSGEYQFHNGKRFLTDWKPYSKTTHVSCSHKITRIQINLRIKMGVCLRISSLTHFLLWCWGILCHWRMGYPGTVCFLGDRRSRKASRVWIRVSCPSFLDRRGHTWPLSSLCVHAFVFKYLLHSFFWLIPMDPHLQLDLREINKKWTSQCWAHNYIYYWVNTLVL